MIMRKHLIVLCLSMILMVGIVGTVYALPMRPAPVPFFSNEPDYGSIVLKEGKLFLTSEIEESFNFFSLLVDAHFESDSAKQSALKPPLPTGVAGVKIYIDPQTGQITTPPAEVTARERRIKLSPKMQNALSTSSEGLTIRKSEIPGGGYIIDLKGRFQQSTVVTIEPDGTMKKR